MTHLLHPILHSLGGNVRGLVKGWCKAGERLAHLLHPVLHVLADLGRIGPDRRHRRRHQVWREAHGGHRRHDLSRPFGGASFTEGFA